MLELQGTSVQPGNAKQLSEFQGDINGNLLTSLNTRLDRINDDITTYPAGATYVNLSASGVALTGAGVLVGMYVNSTNVGTIKLWDNTAGSGTVINNTITPAIGYHDLGRCAVGTGVYATIGGTALDVTLYVIPA